jgi:hypothetical protein
VVGVAEVAEHAPTPNNIWLLPRMAFFRFCADISVRQAVIVHQSLTGTCNIMVYDEAMVSVGASIIEVDVKCRSAALKPRLHEPSLSCADRLEGPVIHRFYVKAAVEDSIVALGTSGILQEAHPCDCKVVKDLDET